MNPAPAPRIGLHAPPTEVEEKGSSILKALALLEGVIGGSRPMTMADLATALGLSKPTAHRIAVLLEREGFLERHPMSRRFIVGPRLIDLSIKALQASVQHGHCHAILKELSDVVGETCNLGMMVGNEVVYLDRVEAAWPLGLSYRPGSRVPIHCTAIGKMFLSRMPRPQRDALIRDVVLQRFTDNTITDPDALTVALERIRAEDAAIDDQEYLVGVVCVAVPVLGPRRKLLAAVAASAPVARLPVDKARAQIPILRDAAARLSKAFAASARSRPDADADEECLTA
jgi:DNA-binding IclR family transcriptional regulator